MDDLIARWREVEQWRINLQRPFFQRPFSFPLHRSGGSAMCRSLGSRGGHGSVLVYLILLQTKNWKEMAHRTSQMSCDCCFFLFLENHEISLHLHSSAPIQFQLATMAYSLNEQKWTQYSRTWTRLFARIRRWILLLQFMAPFHDLSDEVWVEVDPHFFMHCNHFFVHCNVQFLPTCYSHLFFSHTHWSNPQCLLLAPSWLNPLIDLVFFSPELIPRCRWPARQTMPFSLRWPRWWPQRKRRAQEQSQSH